jgi:hypothetical protein
MRQIACIFSLLAFFVLPTMADSQDSITPRSVGSIISAQPNDAEVEINNISLLPKQWINRQLVLLDKESSNQDDGYDEFSLRKTNSLDQHKDATLETSKGALKYERFCGKVLTITGLDSVGDKYLITFHEPKNNVDVYATVGPFSLLNIALLDNLERTKKRWLGRTIYVKSRTLSTYDAKKDVFQTHLLTITQPLRVTDICWGLNCSKPLWIIVKNDKGEEYYYEIAYYFDKISKKYVGWEDAFFEHNPKIDYPQWSQEIWDDISCGMVSIGMDRDAVILSAGQPKSKKIEAFADSYQEQWIYDDQYVYFDSSKVSATQSH